MNAKVYTDSTALDFVITRVFDAPRDVVFKAWTEVERLAQWWGPKGFTMFSTKLDLRPGGLFHYGMRTPGGEEMWGKFVFREIVTPARIVFVNSFSDPQARTTRHLWSEKWPLEMLITVIFTEEGNKTRIDLRSTPLNASESECQTFKAGHPSMRQGFGGTFDQLVAYLARS